jgi:hypothetical protein
MGWCEGMHFGPAGYLRSREWVPAPGHLPTESRGAFGTAKAIPGGRGPCGALDAFRARAGTNRAWRVDSFGVERGTAVAGPRTGCREIGRTPPSPRRPLSKEASERKMVVPCDVRDSRAPGLTRMGMLPGAAARGIKVGDRRTSHPSYLAGCALPEPISLRNEPKASIDNPASSG